MPEHMGISHIDLTVSDCERAAAWCLHVVGFTPVNRTSGETFETRTLVHPSGIAVPVMTHDATAESGAFDERRVGLDHLAFRVANSTELQRWVSHGGNEPCLASNGPTLNQIYGYSVAVISPECVEVPAAKRWTPSVPRI